MPLFQENRNSEKRNNLSKFDQLIGQIRHILSLPMPINALALRRLSSVMNLLFNSSQDFCPTPFSGLLVLVNGGIIFNFWSYVLKPVLFYAVVGKENYC